MKTGAGGADRVVEHLPSKYEAEFKPQDWKNKKGK
jgi:hypothetical protein